MLSGPKGTAAVQRLSELVDPAEVVDLVREVRAVVDPARALRVERVGAEWAAVARAIGGPDERVPEDLGLTAGVGDRCPLNLEERLSEQAVRVVDRAANQNVGPVADTLNDSALGNTNLHVRSRAEWGALETGSSSGSSWPEQPAAYWTSNTSSM